MKRLAMATLLLAGAAAPPLPAQATRAADSAAIAAASRAFSAAYMRNDTVALGDAYVDSAVAYPPGREIVGRAAIRHSFAWPEGYRQIAHAMTSERLTIDGDMAIDVGTWTSTGQREGQEPRTASERYLVVWIRQADGQWKILYDMWHQPPRRAAP